MLILLDIDGVLIPNNSWKQPLMLDDGFPAFTNKAVQNLNVIITDTKASVVLTTSHRDKYTIRQWEQIFSRRGILSTPIKIIKTIVNQTRADEISEWIKEFGEKEKFVIIDDDTSLNGLPDSVKQKCVMIKPLIGLTKEDAKKAIRILLN